MYVKLCKALYNYCQVDMPLPETEQAIASGIPAKPANIQQSTVAVAAVLFTWSYTGRPLQRRCSRQQLLASSCRHPLTPFLAACSDCCHSYTACDVLHLHALATMRRP